MPFIIRIIIQRGLALFFSFLAFIGIAPEARIPTSEEAIVMAEERTEIVETLLSEEDKKNIPLTHNYNLDEIINDAEKSLLQESKTSPLTETSTTKTLQEKLSEINLPNQNIAPEKIEIILPQKLSEEIKNEEVVSDSSSNIEDVLVNIICLQKEGNLINAHTGSGIIISPKGLVITNAHVALPFLIEQSEGKNKMDCVLYKENIPTFGYKAELIYISEEWVKENAEIISALNPKGTGENDYALLYINKNTNPALSVPRNFSYKNINTKKDYVGIGDEVLVAGFPGAPKTLIDLNHAVNLKQDIVKIYDVYTFMKNSVDVFSTEITEVAAKGASGGGVFKNNELVGLIVTTSGPPNNSRINALTTDYINRDLISDYGLSFGEVINSNYTNLADTFEKNLLSELSELVLQYL